MYTDRLAEKPNREPEPANQRDELATQAHVAARAEVAVRSAR